MKTKAIEKYLKRKDTIIVTEYSPFSPIRAYLLVKSNQRRTRTQVAESAGALDDSTLGFVDSHSLRFALDVDRRLEEGEERDDKTC